MKGNRWWTKADDPWQCLATCIEVRNALTSPVPEEYMCSLPVHQDRTRNGLRHYAALGGDAQGAAWVNLAAPDRPSDVRTYVAHMVEKSIAEDLEWGHEYAKLLSGKIFRKVIKQTVYAHLTQRDGDIMLIGADQVMTTVYGVMLIGGREIEWQLKDWCDISAELCWLAASYLAKKVLASI